MLNIKGLDMKEISKLMLPYVVNYFSNCQLSGLDDSLFAESCKLDFSELEHLIPKEYHNQYKDGEYWFNGASGYVLFQYKADEFRGKLYTAMLISDEQYENALFLLLQVENDNTHTTNDILLVDFIKGQLL